MCIDGRVTLAIVDGHVEIKYQHLNPATYFQEVVNSARAVILAGGTMSPVRSPLPIRTVKNNKRWQIDDVVHQLFSDLPSERLSTFSCGHIIPAKNLQTLVLKKGPRGSELQFKYQQRSDEALVRSVHHAAHRDSLIRLRNRLRSWARSF